MLAGVLDDTGVTIWSDVRAGAVHSIDGVWLRLAVDEPGAVGLLTDPVRLAAAGRGSPFLLWRSEGVVAGASLGLLTLRRCDGGVELGARGVGPDGRALAERVLAAVAAWDADRPALPAVSLHPAGTPDGRLPPGTVVEKTHRRLVATYS